MGVSDHNAQKDQADMAHNYRKNTCEFCISFKNVYCRTVRIDIHKHGLSQQGVWVPFWTPTPLKRTPQDTHIFLCGISKNPNLKLKIEFFHLLIIPMTLFNYIMPYFDEFIHVYG